MPIRYSCFISYPHGQGELLKQFIERLKTELQNRIDFYLNHPPYHDEARLRPGYRFNEALAQAICESVCMIVVYVPKYEKSEYCLREYAAMEDLERLRRQLLGDRLKPDLGMIIPVVLRCAEEPGGQAKLPNWITESRQYSNFTKYATGTDDIFGHPDNMDEIEKIARVIDELYVALSELDVDPCGECREFRIPDAARVSDRLVKPRWAFPGWGNADE